MLPHTSEPESARLYTSHERLLRCQAQGLLASGLKVLRPYTLQAGVNRSTHLGRGTEFIELRPYSPGDDIRHMDWRATARSESSWTRAFESDLNFAATFIVDLRNALFFGSERFTKTLLATELAAIAAWDHLGLGYAVQFIGISDHGLNLSAACRSKRELQSELAMLARIQSDGQAFRATDMGHSSDVLLDYLVSYGSQRDVFCFSSLSAPMLLNANQFAAVADHHALAYINICDPLDSDLLHLSGIELSDGNMALMLDELGSSGVIDHRYAVDQIESSFAARCAQLGVRLYAVTGDTSAQDAYKTNSGFGRFQRGFNASL